jgi:hypothetical protein
LEVLKRTVALGALALAVAWLAAPGVARSQAEESQILAAFLYNFAKFVEWPDEAFSSAESPLRIGVLGEDPFDSALETTIDGKTADGRPIEFERAENAEALNDCHIVFISRSERERIDQVVQVFHDASVLTVGDTEGFAHRGVVINLVEKKKKIAFEINLSKAHEADLKVSSRLLGLATIVGEPTEQEG